MIKFLLYLLILMGIAWSSYQVKAEVLTVSPILCSIQNIIKNNTMKEIFHPYGYICLTTNKINRKRYVGQHTSQKLDKRYYGSGLLINKALKKYGKENFKVQILEYCYSLKDLNDRERCCN